MKFTLTLTEDMIKVIGLALGEMPTKMGMPVALEFNRQIAEQRKPRAVPKAADATDSPENGASTQASA